MCVCVVFNVVVGGGSTVSYVKQCANTNTCYNVH